MANTKTGIAAFIIPALIFTFFFYSCKNDTALEPLPGSPGIKGKVTDSTGAALSDVKVCLTFYNNYFPDDSVNSAVVNKIRLSKISSTKSYPSQLYQNFPNPVINKTFFRFSIPSEGEVSFKITDKLTKSVVYSYTDNLVGGLYQMERNLRDSLKLKNGLYSYTLNFKSKTGESFSDTKELFLLSSQSNPNATSDTKGNYFLPYESIFDGDTVIVKRDEYTGQVKVLGNVVYIQFQKEGYSTTVIQAFLFKDNLLEKNIVMRKLK